MLRRRSFDVLYDIAAWNLCAVLENGFKYNPDQPRVPAGNPDGGQWTSDGGETGMNAGGAMAPDTWGNPEMFADKFTRHGTDFSAASPEDYANQANQFYQRAQQEKLPAIEYPNGGEIGIYDPASNTFGIYNPNGMTKTFYKPTSPTYFQRQIDTYVPRGDGIINPLPSEGGGSGGGFGRIDNIFHPNPIPGEVEE